MEEARKVAESEGVALNQLINVALAEKLAALRTEKYFQERIRRANRAETLRILKRAGKGNSPIEGDDLPPELSPDEQRAGESSKSLARATRESGRLKKRLQQPQT